VKLSKKGKGSFWITKKAIKTLLAHKATAMQINAYLVLAKHTNEGGKLSTSGIKAIHTATGASHPVIEKAVGLLTKMVLVNDNGEVVNPVNGSYRYLVYTAEGWTKATGEVIPDAPFERASVRYVLDDFDAEPEDRVWISNELVTGIGKFTQPLKKIKMCGDVASRLLLICYRENNLEQFGGVSPRAFYEYYEVSNEGSFHGFAIWHGNHKNTSAKLNVMSEALGIKINGETKEEINKPFWMAIESLASVGFIYQMVSVMDSETGNNESQVIYELDAKTKHGYKPVGEEGLGGRTARISGKLSFPVTDSMGRFYSKYASILPEGIPCYMVGIYRLRFRVVNIKNHGVSMAWSRIQQGQRDATEWLDEISKYLPQQEDASRENVLNEPPL